MGRKREILPPPMPSNKLARVIIACADQYLPDQLYKWTIFNLLEGMGANIVNTCPNGAKDLVGSIVKEYISQVKSQEPFADILGATRISLAPYWPLEEQVSSYTPAPVAEIMAQSQYSDMKSAGLDESPSSISDPACGNGEVLLSIMRVLAGQLSSKQLHKWSVSAADKNLLNVQVCATQFLVNGAIFDLSPGYFEARHCQLARSKDTEKVIVKYKFYSLSNQHEIIAPNSNWAGSAQRQLI